MTTRGATRQDGATIIDGKALAVEIFDDAARELADVARVRGFMPGIRVVMIGDDRPSAIYARRILKSAERIGAPGSLIALAADAGTQRYRAVLRELSDDQSVAGVILQLPLPDGIELRGLIEQLDPLKDIDGIHPFNAGLISRGSIGFAPSCAEAALQILRRTAVPIRGRQAVVVGRSNVVGRPVQQLLLREDATVTVCHRQTRELGLHLRSADIVVVAAGVPGLVTGAEVKPGAVVIDCGINVAQGNAVVGDVDLDSVAAHAAAVTPVPGGVGPVTNAVLMHHLARAARAQLDGGFPDVPKMSS